MKNSKTALIWITDILKNNHVPFQITGGLAAIAYGATRPLQDIDIDIPEDKFALVKEKVAEFITYGPEKYKSNKWDLLLMTLNYQGQEIDLGGAYQTKIFNEKTGHWEKLVENLSNAEVKTVYELQLPVIPRDILLSYKKVLSREEDRIDVSEIEKNDK
ncbi:MAG: hypothetical protein ABI370_09860 [Gammaproteobacteria bacterium]